MSHNPRNNRKKSQYGGYPYFGDEETEVGKGLQTCPGLSSGRQVASGSKCTWLLPAKPHIHGRGLRGSGWGSYLHRFLCPGPDICGGANVQMPSSGSGSDRRFWKLQAREPLCTLRPTPFPLCHLCCGLCSDSQGQVLSQRLEVAQAPMPGQRADLYVTKSEDPGI